MQQRERYILSRRSKVWPAAIASATWLFFFVTLLWGISCKTRVPRNNRISWHLHAALTAAPTSEMGLVAKDNPRGNYQRMEIASLGGAIFDVGAHIEAPKYTQHHCRVLQ
jgi:hypothetical protein